jgi:hypothetical protein
MESVPDNPPCDVCGNPAVVELFNTATGTNHLFCRAHEPDRKWGRDQNWRTIRSRTKPGGGTSRMLAAAEDSEEHKSFRIEMCEMRLLGDEGACRYYLSKLTDLDQFALWSDEFCENMREYVVGLTNGGAAVFPFDLYTIGFMVSVLKHEFERSRSRKSVTLSKREKAIVLLLRYPSWSDEQIANAIPTTIKQLQRNTEYTVLRGQLRHRGDYR